MEERLYNLRGKKILLGITGAIAAYKIPALVRLLTKNEASVSIVATENALNFVTETVLQTLSKNKVHFKQFGVENFDVEHISLVDNNDIFVVAPLSANTLGKMACGICDNLITSTFCAFKKDVLLFPSMNCNMFESVAVKRNIEILESFGNVKVFQPQRGFLACGANGIGRMKEACEIAKDIDSFFEKKKSKIDLKNQTFLITSGGTIEKIDPVRYLGNFSSGKMGLEFAKCAYDLGAKVLFVSTNKNLPNLPFEVFEVESAQEMRKKVFELKNQADVVVMTAAVADYRVKEQKEHKIKKNMETLHLELVRNPDILFEISQDKTENQIVIGFCAESENLIENATKKIKSKKCDFIVANDISLKDTGFGSNFNRGFLIDKNLNITKIEKSPKYEFSLKVLEEIYGKNA